MDNYGALINWYKDEGDNTFSVNYPLTETSVVFDVGGYEGNWSSKIAQKYNPFIHIFEPVKSSYDTTQLRFKNNSKIQVFNFGLGTNNRDVKISLKGDGSQTWRLGSNIEVVSMRDAAKIITDFVDLISINIEGEEYELLPHMMETGVICKCRHLQVQFHDYPNCESLRDNIRMKLQKTHVEMYDYPFVWESWRRK